MTIQKELEKLIKDEVLIEIEDYIDDLFEIIASKKDDETKIEKNSFSCCSLSDKTKHEKSLFYI